MTFSLFQELIDRAVSEGLAPGLQAVAFGKNGEIFNGVSGDASSAPLNGDSKVEKMKKETTLWIASCGKAAISLVVLKILEQALSSKIPFSISDLDDHEKLVSILPEFKLGGGNMITKIFEGFGPVGRDGKKELKLRDAKKGCTLRHLLTHTNGLGYYFNQAGMLELWRPIDGSKPHFDFPFLTSKIKDFSYPLMFEPGEEYLYGGGADWLGEFAVRSTGKNLRLLCKELVFEPLGLSEDEIDLVHPGQQAGVHVRSSEKGQFVDFPMKLDIPGADGWNPAEGKAWLASGPIYSSLQTYSKILQACLNHDPRLLTEETWKLAVTDQTTPLGVKHSGWKTTMPDLSRDIDEFSAQAKKHDVGINLLQAQVSQSPTISGRGQRSYAWAGLFNVYWFVDPNKGVGGMIGGQLLPFFDPQMIKLRDDWEKLVCSIKEP